MTRHGKNSTANPVYSYHEKKKDNNQSGYGSKEIRLGKDSVKGFDCCCLTLQPCRNPVITPDGYLFDKEAILEYIVRKKREIAKQLKEYEKSKARRDDEKSAAPETSQKSKETSSVSNMAAGKNKELPSFWIPSLTPAAAKSQDVKKPDEKVRCPMSGKPIKLKDLIDVKFTLAKGEDDKALIARDVRYVCPVTNDVLGNSVPCAVLRTSGSVITIECIEKLIKKDMVDPISGQKLKEKDIIPLERGATGFSGAGIELKAKKDGPAMPHA